MSQSVQGKRDGNAKRQMAIKQSQKFVGSCLFQTIYMYLVGINNKGYFSVGGDGTINLLGSLVEKLYIYIITEVINVSLTLHHGTFVIDLITLIKYTEEPYQY